MRLMTWRALSINPYVEVMQLASRALARMSPEGDLVALSPGSSAGPRQIALMTLRAAAAGASTRPLLSST